MASKSESSSRKVPTCQSRLRMLKLAESQWDSLVAQQTLVFTW